MTVFNEKCKLYPMNFKKNYVRKYPVSDPAGRLEIEYLVSLSFPLVGNPSDSPLAKGGGGLFIKKDSPPRRIRLRLDGPSKMTAGKQVGMTEICNCGRDRGV